jgi:hypothetical protein
MIPELGSLYLQPHRTGFRLELPLVATAPLSAGAHRASHTRTRTPALWVVNCLSSAAVGGTL